MESTRSKMARIIKRIEGLDLLADAVPVQEIGQADRHELDALIGALTMERWEIRVDPETGELDLEGLRRREFSEFLAAGEANCNDHHPPS